MDNQVEFLQLDLLKEIMDTKTKTDKINKKVEKEGKSVEKKKEILEKEMLKYLEENESEES